MISDSSDPPPSDAPGLRPHYPGYLANAPLQTSASMPVLDKYSGQVATHVTLANAADLERAIAAAWQARAAMAAFPADARRDVLEYCAHRFGQQREELALALCIEAGKPIRDARGEVDRLIDTFRIAAGEATRIGGELLNLTTSARSRGYRGLVKRVPIGVCSFITPFNFPLNLVAHKVAPAIAAGCPFVLKPAPRTPIGALVIAQTLAQTALPAGAFSVLNLSDTDASALVEDPRIALLSFTGGAVGWTLKARAGDKKVVLELGGNAACIVDRDPGRPLEEIADRLVFGAYAQSGQSCISVQRIYAHEAVHAVLKQALVSRIAALECGDPRKPSVAVGPLIDAAAADRIQAWIAQALAGGATLLAGGERRGNLVPATLLENVPHQADLYRQEAFGPVATIEAFSDFDDAITRVNDSDFGLQAGVFTSRLDHALRAWDRIETGAVIVGDIPSFRVDAMPYGGVKRSGLGREGVRTAIEEMTEPRLLVIRD